MKKWIVFSFIFLMFASCEQNIYVSLFTGVYDMKTLVTYDYGDWSEQIGDTITSPVEISYESGFQIQTDFLGVPNYNDCTCKHIAKLPSAVVDPNISIDVPYLVQGLVRYVVNGEFIKSKIITAKAKNSRLVMSNSRQFEILFIDDFMRPYCTATAHFEYGDIYIDNDVLMWDVKLIMDSYDKQIEWAIDQIIYQNKLTLKRH